MSKYDHSCRLIETGRHIFPSGDKLMELHWGTISGNCRIKTLASTREVRIERNIGTGAIHRWFNLTIAELEMLSRLSSIWETERHNWCAFDCSFSGVAATYSFYPSGKKAKKVKVGTSSSALAKLGSAEKFIGKDVFKEISPIRTIEGEIKQTGEIWRMGEKHGNPNGECIGAVYHLGSLLEVHAYRFSFKLKKQGQDLVLEPGEDAFLKSLYYYMKNDIKL